MSFSQAALGSKTMSLLPDAGNLVSDYPASGIQFPVITV
jgi:hypothetical protein